MHITVKQQNRKLGNIKFHYVFRLIRGRVESVICFCFSSKWKKERIFFFKGVWFEIFHFYKIMTQKHFRYFIEYITLTIDNAETFISN